MSLVAKLVVVIGEKWLRKEREQAREDLLPSSKGVRGAFTAAAGKSRRR